MPNPNPKPTEKKAIELYESATDSLADAVDYVHGDDIEHAHVDSWSCVEVVCPRAPCGTLN